MLRSPSIRILSYLILLFLAGTMIIPLWTVVATAFSTKFGSLQPGINLWPNPISFEGFDTLFRRLNFVLPFAGQHLPDIFQLKACSLTQSNKF